MILQYCDLNIIIVAVLCYLLSTSLYLSLLSTGTLLDGRDRLTECDAIDDPASSALPDPR